MIKGFFGIPWFGWAAIALVIGVVYSFVWPQKAVANSTGIHYFLLRWGHALTWLLLGINFLLRGISPSLSGAATLIALAAGICYILFIFMTFPAR